MTWYERWDMHNNLRREHREKSLIALRRFEESLNQSDWDEFRREDREANKHWGISQAMFTRRYGKSTQ